MQVIRLTAKPRKETRKGAAKRLRSAGSIPAVAYGRDIATVALSVSPKELANVFQSERGRNSVIELQVEGGQAMNVLLADYQYHPVTRELLHADFYQVRDDQLVDVDVPFELLGKPKGVVLGGTLRQVFRKLPVRCLPKDIPVKLSYDVTDLDLDQHVSAKQLSLPPGVSVRLAPDQTVAGVVTEKKRPEEEAAAEKAPAAAAEGAAPAPAAPPAKT